MVDSSCDAQELISAVHVQAAKHFFDTVEAGDESQVADVLAAHPQWVSFKKVSPNVVAGAHDGRSRPLPVAP